jgi:membrane protease YdiL (CAAX protease family)
MEALTMASILEGAKDEPAPVADLIWRKRQLIEVWVFLFLIVPSLIISLFAVHTGKLSFSLTAVAIIFRDLALVCLILFFLWRNGEPVRKIGWTHNHIGREIFWGVILFFPFFFCFAGADWLFRQAGLSVPATPMPSFLTAKDLPQLFLALVLVSVVAVAEETIFRGYLLLRFGAVMQNMTWAVIFSSLIFAIGHGYEGTAGLASVCLMGVLLAVIYLWRGSLVAPMVVHFLQDFASIVLVGILRLS